MSTPSDSVFKRSAEVPKVGEFHCIRPGAAGGLLVQVKEVTPCKVIIAIGDRNSARCVTIRQYPARQLAEFFTRLADSLIESN